MTSTAVAHGLLSLKYREAITSRLAHQAGTKLDGGSENARKRGL